MEILESCIVKEFSARKPENNAKSALLAYAATQVCEPTGGANA